VDYTRVSSFTLLPQLIWDLQENVDAVEVSAAERKEVEAAAAMTILCPNSTAVVETWRFPSPSLAYLWVRFLVF
jgi:hypothetical protein